MIYAVLYCKFVDLRLLEKFFLDKFDSYKVIFESVISFIANLRYDTQ